MNERLNLVNTSLIQTVFITGAAGLIGSAVAQILLS